MYAQHNSVVPIGSEVVFGLTLTGRDDVVGGHFEVFRSKISSRCFASSQAVEQSEEVRVHSGSRSVDEPRQRTLNALTLLHRSLAVPVAFETSGNV